jgi:hypothetical protein
MTNVSVVTFDVADGSFAFYSKESWETTIEEWRKELAIETPFEPEDIAAMDYYEVVELLFGEEVFIDFVTPGSIK